MIRQYRPKEISVKRACELLGCPRSSFYAKSVAKAPKEDLLPLVEKVVEKFCGYGYRRVALDLGASAKKVRNLMKRHGLLARKRKRKIRTTYSVPIDADNLVRGLKPTRCDQVFVADATFLPLPNRKWAYMAVVMDLYSRQVKGYAIGTHLDTALTARALRQVLQNPSPKGWIHHSDRGSTYVADDYRKLVQNSGGIPSFSRPGKPGDNAFMESFMSILKGEHVDRHEFLDLQHLRESIAWFIDLYNKERRHSSLGNRSPDQFAALQQGLPS